MDQPKRVQKKGFFGKLPENTKIVNRPSRWGNPYKVDQYGRDQALDLFRVYISQKLASGELDISELKGKNLACFCSLNDPCHADILLDLANKQD